MALHNEIGEEGERIVEKDLINKGFSIIARNYRKKWGELDIVAQKDNIVHFVEVKTVSRTFSHGNVVDTKNNYRPEDNMHPWKVKRLKRALQTFILENSRKIPAFAKASAGEAEWQFDLACVYLDPVSNLSKIMYSDNIIL